MQLMHNLDGRLEAGVVSSVPAFSSASALKGNLNSAFMLTPTLPGYGEGGPAQCSLWKESVACGVHGSLSPTTNTVPSSQCSPLVRHSKAHSQTFWCRESLAKGLCSLILQ